MESAGELAWFRGEVLRSIVRPRAFARSLGREHFGLAGVLVVIGAGVALSLTIDLLVLAAKGIGPGSFIARLIFESLLLGARLAISVAVVALVVYLGMRVTRQGDLTLDQCFNAVAFAFAPIIVGPPVALVAVFEPKPPDLRRCRDARRRVASPRGPRSEPARDPAPSGRRPGARARGRERCRRARRSGFQGSYDRVRDRAAARFSTSRDAGAGEAL